MPWKECSVTDERPRFVAKLLDGESMSDLCREFGISRKTGYKIFNRYKKSGFEALSDRCRRPVRYANQLPPQIESLIVSCKREKPPWGARKIRDCSFVVWTRTCESWPRAPSTLFCTATAWSKVSAAHAIAQPVPNSPPVQHPTICGALTSRASSSSATASTATR